MVRRLKMIKIKEYKITCEYLPFQVECITYDNDYVYIHSRNEHFKVGIGRTLDEAINNIIYGKNYDVYGISDMIEETKSFLDFTTAKNTTEIDND